MGATEHRELAYYLGLGAGSGKAAARLFRQRVPKRFAWLVDALGQPFRGWDGDADSALWYLFRLVFAGMVDVTTVSVGHSPARDRERARNQQVLNEALATFGAAACVDQEQHAAESDGHVHLDTALPGLRCGIPLDHVPEGLSYKGDLDQLQRNAAVVFELPVGPLEAPLEIGYTDPSRTFKHLCRYGSVARWPYGVDSLVVLSVSEWGHPVLHDMLDRDLALLASRREVEVIRPVNHRIDVWRMRLQLLDATSHLPPEQAANRYQAVKADISQLAETLAAGKPPQNSGIPVTVGPGFRFSARDALGLEPQAWSYLSPDARLEIAGRAYGFHRPAPDDEFTVAIRAIALYHQAMADLDAGKPVGACVKTLTHGAGAALPIVLSGMLTDDDFDDLHGRMTKAEEPAAVIARVLEAVQVAARIYRRWPDLDA